LMTSPDETLTLKSPPLITSPTIHTMNNDLFGVPSNQQSKTGKHIILSVLCNLRAANFQYYFHKSLPEAHKTNTVYKRKHMFIKLLVKSVCL
jgi:hypothetical protein